MWQELTDEQIDKQLGLDAVGCNLPPSAPVRPSRPGPARIHRMDDPAEARAARAARFGAREEPNGSSVPPDESGTAAATETANTMTAPVESEAAALPAVRVAATAFAGAAVATDSAAACVSDAAEMQTSTAEPAAATD